jgi:hypothetical protein
MGKKSKSQRIEKEQLQPLLDFLNTDFGRLDGPEFLTLVWNYLKFIRQSNRNFIDTRTEFQKLTEGLLERPESDTQLERKKLLKGLQSHLRSKVVTVIKSTERGETGLDKALLTMMGTRTVVIDIDSDRFVDEFIPKNIRDAGNIDLRKEKHIAEMVFADMLRDYDLKPKRFGFCAKEGCDNLLYQFDLRQRYCSDRCSGAERQKKLQGKRQIKKRKPKKGRKT